MPLDPCAEAQRIIDRFWKDRSFPVCPVTIGRMLGLEVLDTKLPENVSGALIKKAGKDPIIVLDKYDNDNRKRFSCSHELGHYVARSESKDIAVKYEYVDLRDASASTGNDLEEIFANQFAAHLLMPDKKIKRLAVSNKSYLEIAIFFGVSVEALKFKLNSLRMLW